MRTRAFTLNGFGPALLGSVCLLTALAGTAEAQTAATAPPASSNNQPLEEVVVTGLRASLQSATEAKREAVGFSDSVFAEDIGKFPDTNIAESFNRIPGITITRETTGEGLNITIRGLGTNFTKILLNNAPVAVASTGRTDSQSTNREVDLDLFPTELFTQLTVRKSSSASMIEGGAAGTVNMRSARPFDSGGGERLTFGLQGTKNTNADDLGGRASVLASKTWDTFGVLIGAAGVRNKVRTTGFETIGWTNPNLSAAQCGAATGCNLTGGGNWTIPATVPANAGNGLTAGAAIDQNFLLQHNPGLTIQQLDNAIIPRLGRPSDEFGTKDRYNGIVSLEYRPTDDLHFFLDSIYGKKKNDLQRIDMNWVGRNGSMVPLNMQVDRSDCSTGCVVNSATFANAQFFLEFRPFIEDVDFWGVNPGFDWKFTDTLSASLQVNKTNSNFHRESPTVLVITPGSSGVTVDYTNNGGIPSIGSNVDLNNPASFGWPGGRVNIQDEKRNTQTKGVRGSLDWKPWDVFNVNVGAAYDDVARRINAYDNSQAWQNALCGDNPNLFLPAPNGQPPCEGLVTGTPPAAYPTYPGLGTNYTTGRSGPVVYQGSLVPNASLASYLKPGPDGFVTVDWNRIKADGKYDSFHDSAPEVGASNTGASGGYVREKTTGVYTEFSGDTEAGGNRLRYTAGIRRVKTEQTIGGLVSFPDPRNSTLAVPPATQIADGSRYPNTTSFVTFEHNYYNTLPSFEVAYNTSDNSVIRGAASRTLTRPDPNAMLPGVNFSGTSADTGTVGNPALKPFLSENLDLGFEYYTGKEGYVGVAAFRKRVTGFTRSVGNTVPFSDLAQFGITYDTLNKNQRDAIDARGGPGVATVVLNQQQNASGALIVNGLELNWVQPLDFALARFGLGGLGISANFTLIDQSGSGAAPAIAVGVAPHTYNITAYYENHGVTARLSHTYAAGSPSALAPQNGITAAGLFTDAYKQWDFSSSLSLSDTFGWGKDLQITADVINLTDEKQRSYFQFENAAFTNYDAGRQYMVGVRGRF